MKKNVSKKALTLNSIIIMKNRRSERNLCNCVKKPEKNSGLQRGYFRSSYMIYFIYH